MEASLDGRVIAVAGAAGGLGPTVVRRLARSESTLCLCGRERARLEDLAAETGAHADVDVVDLLDPDAARGWAGSLAERHGRVDALVHLVGGWRGG
jgi:NADP-dependent 3-hydroxy acid dehydrogenase YdfG